MAHKIVRFARVLRTENGQKLSHYAGHYTFPCINENDTVEFVSRFLTVKLTFKPDAQELFQDNPPTLTIEPCGGVEGSSLTGRGRTLTAVVAVDLEAELRKSNIIVEAWNPSEQLNYGYNATIDPCW